MTPTVLTLRSARVKQLRRLSRRSERSERRLFLAEGANAVEAALAAGVVEEVFSRPDRDDLVPPVPDGVPHSLVDDRALAALSDAVTPAGVVALCRAVDVPLEQALAGRTTVICSDVNDPGNAGTIIRTADASGAGGVVLAGTSVDVHNAKTVRSSAGSVFHLPVAQGVGTLDAVGAAREAGYTVLATELRGSVDLFETGDLLDGRVAWLFGSEAHGLSPEAVEAADHRVRIPLHGRAESLNLAAAAALCLYESARRR